MTGDDSPRLSRRRLLQAGAGAGATLLGGAAGWLANGTASRPSPEPMKPAFGHRPAYRSSQVTAGEWSITAGEPRVTDELAVCRQDVDRPIPDNAFETVTARDGHSFVLWSVGGYPVDDEKTGSPARSEWVLDVWHPRQRLDPIQPDRWPDATWYRVGDSNPVLPYPESITNSGWLVFEAEDPNHIELVFGADGDDFDLSATKGLARFEWYIGDGDSGVDDRV